MLGADEDRIEKRVKVASEISDMTIVNVHWGEEYTHTPTERQRELAQKLADWGADIIIGTHPHVIQPVEYVTAADGRKVLVIYSLGNFISAQDRGPRMLGGMMHITVTKDYQKNTTEVTKAKFTGTVTHYDSGFSNVRVYNLADYTDALASRHGVRSTTPSFSLNYLNSLLHDVVSDEFWRAEMAEEIDRYYYERTAAEHGFECVCGIDEAGRGPLAGPVFAAAVILPKDYIIEGLNDSKKLSEKKRDLLFDEIKEHAVYAVASASVEEIDEMNILNATFLAMRRAFEALPERPQAAFVDGNRLPGLPVPSKAIVKGDSLSASIAAASIMAKVSRDRYMLSLDEQYPEYCFKKHKGYGTKLHYEKYANSAYLPSTERRF